MAGCFGVSHWLRFRFGGLQCYTASSNSRKEADAILYRALRAEGVARWRAWLFWAGVRIGGAKHFTNTPTRSGFSSSGD
ncbi:DUF1353 domain-containing protein [Pseudomonas mohnii]|uniref:DUF1353 domain-containing protein n=1 Tax=Pseudomonas mohnii TaxID=395600 RepID=UPI00244B8A5A|nr:DUF1353 domain-containing protein [Pseudomonas mohnii]